MESIKTSLAELSEQFNAGLEEIKKEIKTSSPATSPTSNITSQLNSFRLFVLSSLQNLKLQVELLSRQYDETEMRSRRKMILVHGVPESKKENTSELVSGLLTDNLKTPEVTTDSISRSFRLGRYDADKPRAIVVKFRDVSLRNKIWYSKKALKGTGITLSEFLTKSRHEIFLNARRRFGISNSWTREGYIYVVGSDGTSHRITSMSELNSISNSLDAPAPSSATIVAETVKDSKTLGLRPRRTVKK